MEAADPGGLKAAEAAAQRLRIDYAAAEVLRALAQVGVEPIVLKGAPLVRWLYGPNERRGYADCDLLVAPAECDLAGAELGKLGFAPELAEGDMPDWWRGHGVEWFRRSDAAAVDLHRTLPGAQASAEQVWKVLSSRTQPVDIAGFEARALDIPGLALQLALHTAQHGGLDRQVRELELALELADDDTWREVADLAAELDAVPALVTGLSFAAGGPALIERLELRADQDVQTLLQAGGLAEPQTIEQFARAGSGARLSMVRHKLFPPATFMRKWSPLARRGPVGLALAYVWRPIWLVLRMPRAMQQWRAARRAVDGR